MAAQTKIPLQALDAMDFNEILALRFADLEWRVPLPELYENLIDQVVIECATRSVGLDLKFFIAKEWLSPEATTAVGLPFYLMHPKLTVIEHEFKSEAEGASPESFLRLLRHEIGHCLDHAYGISRRRDFRALFGSPLRHYDPDFYRPDYGSRDFVDHLPGHYAQAHPLEDFAETFAVWLDPKSQWRTRYRRRPTVLRKLNYMERVVHEHAGLTHAAGAALLGEAQRSHTTLGEHYKRQLRLLAKIRAHVTMNK
ncbi:MAG TPA: putative zinc-binding metallopeptidase [Bdellovibrionota bacterium]|nr:putative zinc-binding metallopeptidase [Bdellovibrionota bacterium]